MIIPGLIFIYIGLRGGELAPMVMPGGLITATGVILFYQNLTDHWASWAYMWSLYGVAIGLQHMGRHHVGDDPEEDAELLTIGRYFIQISFALFIGLALFFEMVIFNDGGFITGLVIPAALIVVGLWILSRTGTIEIPPFFQDFFDRLAGAPSEKRKRKNEDLAGPQFYVNSAFEEDDTPTTHLRRV